MARIAEAARRRSAGRVVEQGIVLETERLRLREFKREDTDALLAILGDPVAMQFYPAPFDRAEVERWIARNRRATLILGLVYGPCR